MRFLSFLVVVCSSMAAVNAHSWVDFLQVIAQPGGKVTGEKGYIRGYEGHFDPISSHRMIDMKESVYHASQVTATQKPNFPRLKAAPGALIKMQWLENGHTTSDGDRDRPGYNAGLVYMYGTSTPTPMSLAEIRSGNKAKLLTQFPFDDGKCAENGSQGKKHADPRWKAGGGGPCYGQVKIPETVQPGTVYTLYWIWDYSKKLGNAAPPGYTEWYSSVMDIDIIPGAAKPPPPAPVEQKIPIITTTSTSIVSKPTPPAGNTPQNGNNLPAGNTPQGTNPKPVIPVRPVAANPKPVVPAQPYVLNTPIGESPHNPGNVVTTTDTVVQVQTNPGNTNSGIETFEGGSQFYTGEVVRRSADGDEVLGEDSFDDEEEFYHQAVSRRSADADDEIYHGDSFDDEEEFYEASSVSRRSEDLEEELDNEDFEDLFEEDDMNEEEELAEIEQADEEEEEEKEEQDGDEEEEELAAEEEDDEVDEVEEIAAEEEEDDGNDLVEDEENFDGELEEEDEVEEEVEEEDEQEVEGDDLLEKRDVTSESHYHDVNEEDDHEVIADDYTLAKRDDGEDHDEEDEVEIEDLKNEDFEDFEEEENDEDAEEEHDAEEEEEEEEEEEVVVQTNPLPLIKRSAKFKAALYVQGNNY